MSSITGLHHVQVAAPPGCERAARAFYGDLLGFEEVAKPSVLEARGGCWFRSGAGELHVGVEDPFAPAAKAHPAFLVESMVSLDRLAAALLDAGVEVRWADDAEIPAQLRFHVSDPWGNRIEFVTARAG